MRPYLDPGERVQLEARPHGIALVRPLARSLALAAAGAALVVLGSAVTVAFAALGAVFLAIAALLALRDVVRWDRTQVVLTTEKLVVVYGLLRRRVSAVRLAGAGPVELEQSLLGRVLGYGTVSAGGLEIPYVPNPRQITSLLG